MSEKILNKRDIILIIILIAAAVIGCIFFYGNQKAGHTVVVHDGNKELASFPLEKDTEYLIETAYGENHLVIKGETACIDHADCENQTCVMTGVISEVGQMIVCLPHEIIVEIRE